MAREDRTEEAPARVPVRKRVRQLLSQLGPARLIATLLFLLMAVLVARLGWQLPLVRDAERALYDARATAMAPHVGQDRRSEEHTSELQSLMRNSDAVFCLTQKKNQ